MKTNELIQPNFFIEAYQQMKKEMHSLSMKIMLTRMVVQNLADVIPDKKWKLIRYGWSWTRYEAREGTTIADLDKLTKKLAKIFNEEPSKEIMKSSVVFSWYIRFRLDDRVMPSVLVELAVGNTESCELIEKEVLTKTYELTGYCKQLQEREYLVAR
jgi:hypothetical protein